MQISPIHIIYFQTDLTYKIGNPQKVRSSYISSLPIFGISFIKLSYVDLQCEFIRTFLNSTNFVNFVLPGGIDGKVFVQQPF